MSNQNVTEKTNSATTQSEQSELVIQKVFIKNMSFEAFQKPVIPADKQVKFTMNVETKAEQVNLQNKIYEISITLTLTAALEEKNIFFGKLSQAGFFTLKNFSEEQMNYMLNAYCPNILFPYARRAIADTILHAGFPEMHLAPINFDAMYQQKMQKEAQQTTETQH